MTSHLADHGIHRDHEILNLNEPYYDNDSASEEKIDRMQARCSLPVDEQIANKLSVEKAMETLTTKETTIIREILWNQRKETELSEEMHILHGLFLKRKAML